MYISRINEMIDTFDICYLRSSNHCEEIMKEVTGPNPPPVWRNSSWDFGSSAFYACVALWAGYWSNKKRQYLLTGHANVDDYDLILANFEKYKSMLYKMPKKKEAIDGWNERIARKPLFTEMKFICVDPYIILPITNDHD